ncbi:hypothetical protein [Prochlorococcus sp. MIT 1341]|uniref:hypothetical protein n=1 Tax=Prochlorococcus sp. MIT 1341 TaxID=3096221 RepID=UPI002A7567A6|nr:hypothetical protein [Prochlorococcus sp. MIT 1341]
MKKILVLAFALSLNAVPVLAWGSGDCPYSKTGENQETVNEKREKTQDSEKD